MTREAACRPALQQIIAITTRQYFRLMEVYFNCMIQYEFFRTALRHFACQPAFNLLTFAHVTSSRRQ
jgi:hypothetical protein